MHDPEQLEGIGGADHQVVVGVEPGVEVEAAQLVQAQQHHHDELDVRPRRMVTGVEDHLRPLPEREAVGEGGSPVRDVGRVERRLEELVLEQHALAVAEAFVRLGQRVGEPVLAVAQRVLTRVVGTVGEPQLEIPRSGLVHDVDALEEVGDRLAAHRGIRVGDAAQPVVVVLEDVGVDRADAHAVIAGVGGELAVVVDPVPRDVQRHGGRGTRVGVHPGCVEDLLVRVAWHARLGEDLEAGARVAERPRRELDRQLVQPGGDGGCDGHRAGAPSAVRSPRRPLPSERHLNRFTPYDTLGRDCKQVAGARGATCGDARWPSRPGRQWV